MEIYKLDVVEIPTNKPMIREDCADVVYKTEKGKFNAVIEDIIEHHKKGQPVLVGTITIEKSEELSAMLKRRGVKHEVLNAKYHEKEAEIVAQAGRKGAVTIATNMAGRGTDIIDVDKRQPIGCSTAAGRTTRPPSAAASIEALQKKHPNRRK